MGESGGGWPEKDLGGETRWKVKGKM
jgi:hypothetical protein